MPPPIRLTGREMEYKDRKYPRLKEYNYSLPGYYYVTIHNERNAPLLSRIERGDMYHRAYVNLTEIGVIAIEELLLLEKRYTYLLIDKYVIMPTHIHAIFRLTAGMLPRPGLTDVVGAYKSLTTRAINAARNTPGRKQFQRSFYETVIRNETAYRSCWKYIDENPDRWWKEQEDFEWDCRIADENGEDKTPTVK